MNKALRDVLGMIFLASVCFLILLLVFGMPWDELGQNPIALMAIYAGAVSGTGLMVL